MATSSNQTYGFGIKDELKKPCFLMFSKKGFLMNEQARDERYFGLSKAEAEAYREYQQKFDILKDFDQETLTRVNNVGRAEEREKLEAEVSAAYEKRKLAIKAFSDYRKLRGYKT